MKHGIAMGASTLEACDALPFTGSCTSVFTAPRGTRSIGWRCLINGASDNPQLKILNAETAEVGSSP